MYDNNLIKNEDTAATYIEYCNYVSTSCQLIIQLSSRLS
jgi:hypothetical protein